MTWILRYGDADRSEILRVLGGIADDGAAGRSGEETVLAAEEEEEAIRDAE